MPELGQSTASSKSRSIGVVPLIIAASFFVEELDASIITTSLPQMAADLGVSSTQLGSAVTAYMISLAVFLPISGWVADRFGARRTYCTAMVVFAVGSLISAMAGSLPVLVAGRIVQGVGGALMTPVGRQIVVRAVPKDRLVVATNYMIAPALVGSMLGPVVGGFVTTYFSWRWNFYVNIPIAIAGVALALRFIPSIEKQSLPGRFDWRGFLLLAICLFAAQIGMEKIGRGGVADIGILFAISFAALAGYARHAHLFPNAILPVALLKIRTFAVSIIAGGVARIAAGALPFLLPLLFQLGFGLNPFQSGLLTVGAALGVFVMRLGASLALRVFPVKTIILCNTILLSAVIAGLSLVNASTLHWVIFLYLFLLGALRSVEFSNVTALAYADLESHMTSGATTFITLTTRFCLCLGVALGAALLAIFAGAESQVSQEDFAISFLVLAGLMLVSTIGFLRLGKDDGWQLRSETAPEKR